MPPQRIANVLQIIAQEWDDGLALISPATG
jgi:hypothetical protein